MIISTLSVSVSLFVDTIITLKLLSLKTHFISHCESNPNYTTFFRVDYFTAPKPIFSLQRVELVQNYLFCGFTKIRINKFIISCRISLNMATVTVLYYSNSSPPSRTVRMVAGILGLQLELRALNPVARDQDTPELTKVCSFS